MSLIHAEHLIAAGLTRSRRWNTPALEEVLTHDAYVLHGRRRGARRVRRYLRRWKAREAARWRAEWIAHPFNGAFDPKGRYWRAYRDAKLAPSFPLPMLFAHAPEVPLDTFRADLLLTRPSCTGILTGIIL